MWNENGMSLVLYVHRARFIGTDVHCTLESETFVFMYIFQDQVIPSYEKMDFAVDYHATRLGN